MKLRVDYLYNKGNNTSTFYVWKAMELIDKLIYEGKMSLEEIKATRERILKDRC